MIPSKSRAATREAMSLCLRRIRAQVGCVFGSVELLLWLEEDTCRYLYRCARESESLIHWLEIGKKNATRLTRVPCLLCLAKLFLYVLEDASLGPVFIKALVFHEKFSPRLTHAQQWDAPFKSTSRFQQLLYGVVFLFSLYQYLDFILLQTCKHPSFPSVIPIPAYHVHCSVHGLHASHCQCKKVIYCSLLAIKKW